MSDINLINSGVVDNFIREMVSYVIDTTPDMEDLYSYIIRQYKGRKVDAYFSGRLNVGVYDIYLPNTYGQEDCVCEDCRAFAVMDTKHFIYVVVYPDHKVEIGSYSFDVEISLEGLGGKRAFYFDGDVLLLRVRDDVYETLDEKLKSKSTEHWMSAPHMRPSLSLVKKTTYTHEKE